MEWLDKEIIMYAKHCRSLKSKSKPKSLAPPPPATPSPSSLPTPRLDLEARMDSNQTQIASLTELIQTRLASYESQLLSSQAKVYGQAWPELDVCDPHPVYCCLVAGVVGSGRSGWVSFGSLRVPFS